MAKLVWLGEGGGEDDDGPRATTWNGTRFERGKAVDIDNPHMIAKARNNPFFSVDGKKPEHEPKDGKHTGSAGPVVVDRTQLSEMKVGELREIAAERDIDVEGLNKSEIVEKLATTPAK